MGQEPGEAEAKPGLGLAAAPAMVEVVVRRLIRTME